MFEKDLYIRARFEPENGIRYSQDHMCIWGDSIPSGIWFRISRLTENILVLTGCGYGCLDRTHGHDADSCYGNGSLFVRV